jgi:hypothetical protein
MQIPDGAHTHGSSGGVGTAVLVVLGAALAVNPAGPILAAVAELVYVLLIVVAAIASGAAVTLIGIAAWRGRRRRLDATRAEVPATLLPQRAAQPLPPPPRPAIERPGELHLHLHGVTAEDVATILRHQEGR